MKRWQRLKAGWHRAWARLHEDKCIEHVRALEKLREKGL